MTTRSEHRKREAAAAVLALAFFAIVGAWHHHPVKAIDDFSLENAGHGVSAAGCHACKLSSAGATLPWTGTVPLRLESVHRGICPDGSLPYRQELNAGRPTRAPPVADRA